MNFAEHQNARIAFRTDGTGPALVLVHGTGGDSESNWSALTDALSSDWTIIRPDYSGSGATRDDGRDLSADYLARQIMAAVDATETRQFHLMGFSLGAALALRIAADHGSRIRSLILLAGFTTPDARLQLEFELWRDLIATNRPAMARLVLLTGFSPDAISRMGPDGVIQATEETLRNANWDGMARQVKLDLEIDVSDAPGRIQAPTLVIGCTHDHMVAPSHARRLASSISGARYAEIPTGHLAPMERPDLLAEHVRSFLTTVS